MRKHPTRGEYNSLIAKAWSGVADDVDAKLLRSAVKGVWRRVTGKPCKDPVVITRRGGIRQQYNHAKRRWEVLINPKQGLRGTVHDLGHYLHCRMYPSDKPHCDRHLEIERDAAEYIAKRFFKPASTETLIESCESHMASLGL